MTRSKGRPRSSCSQPAAAAHGGSAVGADVHHVIAAVEAEGDEAASQPQPDNKHASLFNGGGMFA